MCQPSVQSLRPNSPHRLCFTSPADIFGFRMECCRCSMNLYEILELDRALPDPSQRRGDLLYELRDELSA